MKIKYIIILIVAGVVSYTLINTTSDTKDTQNTEIVSDDSEVISKFEQVKPESIEKSKINSHLTILAESIAAPSDSELQDIWEDEYGCAKQEDCFKELNAQSYEEALWMKRKGYPTMSAVKQLREISRRDLIELSKHGNNNAKKLLAIDALGRKNLKKAKRYARSSIAHGNKKETFGHRLLAETYMHGREMMLASVRLKIAAILGDTHADEDYRRITMNSGSLRDSYNQQAYGYLSSWIGTPIHEWTNDPRPRGSDGG